MRYAIDALLRPPVELWSVLVSLIAASIAALAPWALMMPVDVAYGVSASLFLFAVVRARRDSSARISFWDPRTRTRARGTLKFEHELWIVIDVSCLGCHGAFHPDAREAAQAGHVA